jgi:uncharacterized protein (DUF1778 family)
MSTTARRDTPINIRATAQQRQLIDRAAKALGKSRTDFILETACHAAENTLLERVYIELDDETFDTVLSILENPPEPTQALRDLMVGKYDTDDRNLF